MGDVKNAPPGQSGNPGTPKEKQHDDPNRTQREGGGMGGSGRDNPGHERDKGAGQPSTDPNRERSGGSGGGGQGGSKGH
jgi:hypothetical protein